MHVAAGDVLTSAELIRNQQNGERVWPPFYYRAPLYDVPNYEAFVQSATEKSSNSDYNPSQSIRVTIDTGKDPSDYNFGQTRSRASVGPSIGWFSFNPSGKQPRDFSTLHTGSETSVKVTYDNLEAVSITTGEWYVMVILVMNRTLVELLLTFQGPPMFPSTGSAQTPLKRSGTSPG